jgi:hypothetical protein
MKNLLKTNERRGSERFFLTGKPLAEMRPAPSCPGKLLRISRSAAEIVYCSAESSTEPMTAEIDVLVPDFIRGIFLEKIPVTTVSDLPVVDQLPVREEGYDRMRKRVVKFERLTPEQFGQLQSFIYSYGK